MSTGRWDFYYTLTSVALLSIASAGVWFTFYIGRINIGQGAYALAWRICLGHPDRQIRRIVLADPADWPASSVRLLSVLIGLPILRLRGVYSP